jgi:hypothetical protein
MQTSLVDLLHVLLQRCLCNTILCHPNRRQAPKTPLLSQENKRRLGICLYNLLKLKNASGYFLEEALPSR